MIDCYDHFCFLTPAASPKASKSNQKTTESLPALKKAETPADAAQNWLSNAMAEAKTPSGGIASASKVQFMYSIFNRNSRN